MSAKRIGQQIGGYDIIEAIGGGTNSEIYLGELPGLERRAAIKIPRPGTPTSEEDAARLVAEGQFLAAVDHPNIVRIYKLGYLSDGFPYLALEYLDGITLRKALASGTLSVPPAARIVRETARGLAALHAQDVVCLGLRPESIMVVAGPLRNDDRRTNWIRIAELRGAQARGQPPDVAPADSPYVAPEAVQGSVVDERADVYSLGAILGEMLTVQPDEDLGRLIQACMGEKDARPENMYQFLSRLDEAEAAWSRRQE